MNLMARLVLLAFVVATVGKFQVMVIPNTINCKLLMAVWQAIIVLMYAEN